MGTIYQPEPVKLFAGIIAQTKELIAAAEEKLAASAGAIEARSEVIPFTFTQYYQKEMGADLLRCWVSFKDLVLPGELARIKVLANTLEDGFAVNNNRPVNIDPGYLTMAKLVLASTKDYSHRIYLADGIYGEVTLIYKHNEFTALPWTYPDYQCAAATRFFKEIRETFHGQLP